ncbi:unnamed protein product [Rotaria socialis]|uniref:Dynamin-type G domain-containing protein n=1 Tax=Rotaria socialis TaxID=392032 RepID=A0A817XC58_9BILA|nr:unnamed protein product [Rotaria socialis]CAF3365122.1 unnamed protein product [Rotaria socialis]CAF3535905.1 unnamed protein product [Rotaria socialis]CAF4191264.1 unnamed protein product [Rotaria socialis]CAF4241920.1 unnamed protein product [Rotaria socialis]
MSGSIIHEKSASLELARQISVNSANSPLKLFTQAKTTITQIFKNIASYVDYSNKFLEEVSNADKNLITDDKYKDIQQLNDKVNRILSVISRDHMKVVFFGRTSNGKSTTVNAMLRERILPVGMGHTTNCFLQIEGTDEAEAYVLTPESDEPKSVSSLGSISNALSREKLDSDSLVKILWPKEKCRLIRDDVILVDSPGIDVSANLDQWIENHCLDADVFVLVISAEATITVAEKKFLHNVAQRLSNPNIFILMNRWDATAYEPESVESVRQQHLDRGLEFLCDELKLCDRKQASEHRMFFISAREALLSRNKDPTASPRSGFNEGYQERLEEFSKFEHEFEECISKTAIQTKFEQHTNRGKEIIASLRETTANVCNKSQILKQESVQKLTEMDEKNSFLEHELRAMTESAKEKIRHISEDVYKRVAQTLNDEIKRLYTLIEEFDRPFSSDPEQIPLYKRDLHHWVEERLGSNLQSRLHSALYTSLNSVHREIQDRVKLVLSNSERKILVDSIVPRSDFNVSYRLDCSNLCSDFREDIEFKFSLGFSCLWQRYVQNQKESLTGSKRMNELSSPSLLHSTNDLLTTANNISLLTSKSGLLALGSCALIWRSVGWRVLGVVAGIYGSLFLYEKLMWTKKAQERAFKRQYADYASSKMKLIVDMTSGNASAQVQQELSMYFAQTIHYVDMEKDDLADNMQQLRKDIDQLLKYIDKGKKLRKQGDEIDNELREFSKQYLSSDSIIAASE